MHCSFRRCLARLLWGMLGIAPLTGHGAEPFDPSLKEFVEGFKGKGALTDASQPLTPEQTIQRFKIAEGLQMEVVAHEPVVRQPLNMHFDERGRLWVVQYLQYPFFAGLKIVNYDQYLRAVFDKVPEPPPRGAKGADKITIHEDTDGDGRFDKHKDFVTGLNIATSVAVGRGGVWVLNPPYLLFYPDRNKDDVPDGDPEVHLSGFGLEDTHAVANSLAWGPDGWLYGAQGSTTTSTIKGVRFLGQAIWRYHPVSREFEVFGEGGGNTFSLDFDSKGRAYSGSNNGNTRGLHYVQGGCYIKNWGKHGPLMNPYAFGFYQHMAHEGFEPRFAQSMAIYEGGALPGYEGALIAAMSLVNRVQASRLVRDTSTYKTIDTPPLVLTDDRWFRPVDTKIGPDGAIYLADWYDSRLTHVDPRDTWDRERGRIYRLRAPGSPAVKPFDLSKLSNAELIPVLSHSNKWFRQTAQRIFADRADRRNIPALAKLVETERGQLALEALWALHASGGFTEAFAAKHLEHPNEFVRYWVVRLLGDQRKISPALEKQLAALARGEPDVQVRVQLASSAKRLPARGALPLIQELLLRHEDASDKHQPLLLWWAIESKAGSDRDLLLAMLKDTSLWQTPIFSQHILSRLGQRYTAERSEANLSTAALLLAMAPSPADVDQLVKGMEEGLQGDLVKSVPAALQKQVAQIWSARPVTPTLISFALRLGHEPAGVAALQRVADAKAPEADRKKLLALLAERRVEAAVPVFLDLLKREKSEALRVELLNSLQRFGQDEIGRTLLEIYPSLNTRLRGMAQSILASRSAWARQLLARVDQGQLKPETINVANLTVMQNHRDAQCDALIKKHWGRLRQGSAEKETQMANVRKLLAKGKGNPQAGRETFKLVCATCHTFRGEGAKLGPDLTGYERDNLDFMIPAIVDPSLGIREEFIGFNLTTRDGQSLTGFIVENTPQAVTLLDLNQNRVVIPREQIQELAASATSIMPEGLLDALSEQQVRDLFSYLATRQ